MKNKKYIFSAFIMITITIALIFAKNNLNKNKYSGELISKTAFYLDTFVTVQVYDCKENYSEIINNKDQMTDLVNSAVNLCGKYELIFSKTNENSEVFRFNNGDKTDVEISKELYDVIDKSLYYSRLSDGKFDITISKLVDVWNFKNEIVPDDTTINQALETVNYDNIKLYKENNKYYLTVTDNSELDFGSIAKGYIADEIKNYLLDNGIKNGLINLGGNMLAIGNKPNNSNFKIGIQKPFAIDGELIYSVDVNNKSVVTSGIYQRMFEHEKKIYHHIIDSKSGYPADTGVYSATIIAENSIDADVLSTICVLLGCEKSLELINSIDGIECIIVDKDYNLHFSDGINDKK